MRAKWRNPFRGGYSSEAQFRRGQNRVFLPAASCLPPPAPPRPAQPHRAPPAASCLPPPAPPRPAQPHRAPPAASCLPPPAPPRPAQPHRAPPAASCLPPPAPPRPAQPHRAPPAASCLPIPSPPHPRLFFAVHGSPPPAGRDLAGGRGWEGAALASSSRRSSGPICAARTRPTRGTLTPPAVSSPLAAEEPHGGRAAEDRRRLESLLFPTTKHRRLEPRLFSSPVAVEDRRVQPPSLLDGARYPSWPISSTHGHGESRRRRSRQLLPISSPCVKEGGRAMEKLRVLLPPLPSPPLPAYSGQRR